MGKHNFLGVAIGERAITVAEVGPRRAGGGAGFEVRRAAEFVPPPVAEGTPEDTAAAATGAALGQFLKDNGFAGGAPAVIGVPARWLVAREREVPPSSEQQAAEVLRLQAERMFSAELGELTVDYAGVPDPGGPRGVLIVAMPNRQLRRVVRMLESAGRQVAAVMPSTLALADAVSNAGGAGAGTNNGDGLVLSLSGDAVELTAHRGGAPRLLRHLPVRGPDLGSQNGTRAAAVSMLAGEIRRTVAMMPRGSDANPPAGAGGAETLLVCDGVGLEHGDADAIAREAGVDLRGGTAHLSSLGLTSTGRDPTSRFAPALALAIAGAAPRPGTVDFLHPRLAAPPDRRFGRREAWAAALVGTAVLALVALWVDTRSKESDLAAQQAELDRMAPQLGVAERTASRIGTARGWFAEGRPAVLECLREITAAFPDGGEPIYLTKFSLPENRQGRISGNSPNRDLVFALLDRLHGNRNFADAKVDYTLAAGASSSEVAFSISFTYQGTNDTAGPVPAPQQPSPPPPAPAAAPPPAAVTQPATQPVERR